MKKQIALAFIVVFSVSVGLAVAQPQRVPTGAVLFIESPDMGTAITAALIKKQVPVSVTTDREKATHILTAQTAAQKEGTGERVAKVLMFGGLAGSGKSRDTSITVADAAGSIVFAYNTRKADLQSAAEGVAKHLKNNIDSK